MSVGMAILGAVLRARSRRFSLQNSTPAARTNSQLDKTWGQRQGHSLREASVRYPLRRALHDGPRLMSFQRSIRTREFRQSRPLLMLGVPASSTKLAVQFAT